MTDNENPRMPPRHRYRIDAAPGPVGNHLANRLGQHPKRLRYGESNCEQAKRMCSGIDGHNEPIQPKRQELRDITGHRRQSVNYQRTPTRSAPRHAGVVQATRTTD